MKMEKKSKNHHALGVSISYCKGVKADSDPIEYGICGTNDLNKCCNTVRNIIHMMHFLRSPEPQHVEMATEYLTLSRSAYTGHNGPILADGAWRLYA